MLPEPRKFSIRATGDRFGEIAVATKILDAQQIQDGLTQQAEMKSAGTHKRLGDVMVANRLLNLRGLQKILLEQQRRRKGTAQDVGALAHKKLGDYELLAKLGEGGMGTVYKARDLKMDRIVALKVLSRGLAGDHHFVERFNREIKLTGTLNHPNIVTAYGAGVAEGLPYLAMEYVEGSSLHQYLKKKGRLPEREALTIIRGLAAGLEHAHQHGFIHRDVKPDNALLGEGGAVKVADLGLAKSVDDDQRLTKTGTAIGTPHYISPEQAKGEKNVDHRSDIYSLGATLYTVLTGQRPFDGKNNAEIMLKHLNEELDNPQDLVPEISDATVAVISKMMAKIPGDRYDNCGMLIEDLDRVLGVRTVDQIVGPRGASSIRAPRRRKRKGVAARAKASSGSGCLVLLTLGALGFGTAFGLLGHWLWV